MILLILITAITPTHIHNHPGIWVAGNNLIMDTTTKVRSATESSWLPNLLVLFNFLAIVPSTISLKPHLISRFFARDPTPVFAKKAVEILVPPPQVAIFLLDFRLSESFERKIWQ